MHKLIDTACQPEYVEDESAQEGALLARCREGDEAAWRLLYARCVPLIRSRALRMGASESESQDICQEALLTLSQNIQSVRSAIAFVKTITFRRCADRIRRKKLEVPYEENPDAEMTESAGPAQELVTFWIQQWLEETKSLERAEARLLAVEHLRDGLQKLGSPCRGLLESRFHAESSYKEIAIERKLPEAQVGVNISRCVGRLKQFLQADSSRWNDLTELWNAAR